MSLTNNFICNLHTDLPALKELANLVSALVIPQLLVRRSSPHAAKKGVNVCQLQSKPLLIKALSKDFRFKKEQHIRTQAEYDHVRNAGVTIHCKAFVFQLLLTESNFIRKLGVIASKRVGNAVKRNRAKRLLREVFRLNQHTLPKACEIVLIARAGIHDCKYSDLEQSFLYACRRALKVSQED